MIRHFLVLASLTGLAMMSQMGNQPPGQPVITGQKPPTVLKPSWQFGAVNQQPWFVEPGIRTDLRLSTEQFNRLNDLYAQSYQRFSGDLPQLNGLDAQRRLDRMNTLSAEFRSSFNTAAGGVLNADQRLRFDQLWRQYRGPDVFGDVAVQTRLGLSPRQLTELNGLRTNWETQLAAIQTRYEQDRAGATQQFLDARAALGQQISSVLTPDQRTTWQGLTGDPYRFELAIPGATTDANRPDK